MERGRRKDRKREGERDTQAPELLLMLLLLQPFDNSPPRESREEGRRSEQGGRSKRHLSQDALVLSQHTR